MVRCLAEPGPLSVAGAVTSISRRQFNARDEAAPNSFDGFESRDELAHSTLLEAAMDGCSAVCNI